MAFDPIKFVENYEKKITEQITPTTFSPQTFAENILRQKGVTSKINIKSTSKDLYGLAVQKGYQSDADRILATQTGEETKKIFSGGFISDIFDVLNTLQYGVTGILKGKGFMEGVRTRQSFSDKDALGDNGLPGVIAGIALDIAVDPLTYIAPYTILKKVPGLTKLAVAAKELAFGKKVTKTIRTGEKVAEEIIPEVGKIKPLAQEARLIENRMYGRFWTNKETGEVNITSMGRDNNLRAWKESPERSFEITPQIAESYNKSFGKTFGKIIPGQEAYSYKGDLLIKPVTKSQLIDFYKAVKGVEVPIEGLVPRTFEMLEGGSKIGKWFGQKFIWMFGSDPVYKEAYERSIKNIAVGTQNIANMAKGVSNIAPEVAEKLLTKDETGRFMRVGINELQSVLTPQDFAKVAPAWQKIDELGKQAVDLGLLSKAKYEENLGEYIKNAYTEYEQAKSKGLFGFMKVGIKGIKPRKVGLTQERMAELGQIDNPAYLLFKSVFDLQKDVENAKLFRATAERFASNVVQEGFKQLPKGVRLGDLSGKFVPENIFNAIQEITEPVKDVIGKEWMANFKFFKVIMNPATHARNIASNTILNWWKLGLSPARLDIYGEALKQTIKGGKWVDEAKTVGYNLNTFASNELKTLLDSPEALGFGKTLGNKWATVKNKLGDIYQGEENIAKLAAFIFKRQSGMGIEEAWKVAESATFNYAQVTPFIRKLRTAIWGYPFITFSLKAAPIAVETAFKAPARISIFGKIKNGIEQVADIKETARERAAEPPWIKDGFYIKLPIKDKNGNSAYFDLTYIIPFGDLVSGQLFGRQVQRETGTVESIPEALISNAPFFNFIKEISRNQDFYGDKIWNAADTMEKQLGDLMRHLSKSYLPPLVADQIPGGYKADGTRRQKGFIGALTPQEKENQQRTLMEEILRQVGAKIQPLDADIQETYQEWNRKKALETLLREKGIIKEFKTSYIPKK